MFTKNRYNRYINPPKRRLNKARLALALAGVGATLLVVMLASQPKQEMPLEPEPEVSSTPPLSKAQQGSVTTAAKANNGATRASEPTRLVVRVCKGDTISGILERYLTPSQIVELEQVCQPVFSLSGIRPGHPYTLMVESDHLTGFEYEIDDAHKLVVSQDQNGFSAVTKDIVYTIKPEVVAGSIESSLSHALNKLGHGQGLAVMMEDILGWDVDFGRDIREGDTFRILVEKRFRQGKPAGYDHILAIDFRNRTKTIRAFRFTDSKGRTSYFDATGHSMRKAFLKAPLSFTRISSGYTNRRFHPILKRWRPHHGIDYAAPRGTPIRTIGDGVVVARAYDKAAGRYVKIRHPRGYETVYNHMSRYAKALSKGTQVKQGQIIGYVGATGYATGPHLDFRVKKHGAYINPLRMQSPPTNPVPAKDMKRFRQEIARLAATMGSPLDHHLLEAEATQDDHPKG